MDNSQYLENPFNHTDVRNIYDNNDFPEVISYLSEQKKQLEDSIEWYRKGLLSNPIINIFGRTGSGKTFLIYSLVREYHRTKSGFFIEIAPLDIVEESNVAKLAEYIWHRVEDFFLQELSLPDVCYRPLDLLVYRVYDTVINKSGIENRVRYTPGLFLKEKVPKYDDFCQFLENLKSHRHVKKIFDFIFTKYTKYIDNCTLKWLKMGFLGEKQKCPNYSKSLYSLTRIASLVDLPIFLVCDQFESLEKTRFKDPISIFFTQLFELFRETSTGTVSDRPLFINLLNDAIVDLSERNQHVYSRIPILPHGQSRIFIDGSLNKEQALQITKVYLQKISQGNKPFYPFTKEDFIRSYEQYTLSFTGRAGIRSWLIHCRHMWNVRFHNAVPYWKATSSEQETATGTEKVKDTNDKDAKQISTKRIDPQIEGQKDNIDTASDDKQSIKSKLAQEIPDKTEIRIQSLDDIRHRSLNQDFVNIRNIYESNSEKLLELLYVFMNSLKKDFDFVKMSSIENNYFSLYKDNKKVYIFFSSKSNRGKGFRTDWMEFKASINTSENYFVKCVRCKRESIPSGKEFSTLRSNKKSHYYCFDVESKHDLDWLKNIYGIIYLLDKEKLLTNYELPKIEFPGVIWQPVVSENVENIVGRLQENLLKGIL